MKLNLKKLLITFILLFFIPLYSFPQEKENTEVYSSFINEVLASLEDLIAKNYNKNPGLTERYLFVKDKLYKNELRFSISKSLPQSIVGGMHFAYGKDNKKVIPSVGISDWFIELYKKSPSLVFAVLFHEFQHAYNYFNHYEKFIAGETNKLERYLFEMDANYIEAMFIRDISKANNYKLTNYEKFAVDSLEKDHLNTVSIVFAGYDNILIHRLIGIINNEKDNTKKIKMLEEAGTELIGRLPTGDSESDWNKYLALTSLYSYYHMVPQLLYNIEFVMSKYKMMPADFKLNKYKLIETYREKIRALINQNLEFMEQYPKRIKEDILRD